jgi:hypothetical protein
MRYLTIWRPASGEEGAMPDPAHMASMGKLVDDMTAAGKLINTEPLAAKVAGARVRRSGGQFSVSDKAQRGAGYAFLSAGSREEAIELCKQFMNVAGDGEIELRQVMEFAPQPA